MGTHSKYPCLRFSKRISSTHKDFSYKSSCLSTGEKYRMQSNDRTTILSTRQVTALLTEFPSSTTPKISKSSRRRINKKAHHAELLDVTNKPKSIERSSILVDLEVFKAKYADAKLSDYQYLFLFQNKLKPAHYSEHSCFCIHKYNNCPIHTN